MLRPIQSLNQYRYELSNINIAKTGSDQPIILLADNVKSITIVNNYINNIVPIIQITANVEKLLYSTLTSSETELTLHLLIYKYISNSDIQAKEIYINKKFSILNEYDYQPSDLTMSDTEIAAADSVTSSHTEQTVAASFYLIDKDNLERYRQIKSYSISGGMTELIALMFKDRGFTSLLMNSIPSPYTGPIIIPSGNLLSSLEYLNYRYGIFNTEYIFYMDINDNYLIDKINLGNAVKAGSPSIVNLYFEDNSLVEAGESGNIIENGIYICNIMIPPFVNNLDSYSEMVLGSNIISVDVTDNIQKIGTEGLDRILYVFNHKVSYQSNHKAKEFKKSLTINLIDIDINIINPAMIYNVAAIPAFQLINPISGSYRINESSISLNKSSNNTFNISASIVLTKIVK